MGRWEMEHGMRCCWCERAGLSRDTARCPYCNRMVVHVLPPNTLLRGNRYRIEKALGQGGFGITYRALDTQFERRVAIKEFYPKGRAHRDHTSNSIEFDVALDPKERDEYLSANPVQASMERFQREGRHLARVEHSNIPTIYDNFSANNTHYLVMAFIEGQSLKDRMPVLSRTSNGRETRQPLPHTEIVRIMDDLVSALAATHQQGVFHLDIKPDNILIDRMGRTFLVDFGAARQGSSFDTNSLVALTPQYAPPELMSYPLHYGPYTDIYELGLILYHMLTGELPPAPLAQGSFSEKNYWHPAARVEPWYSLLKDALQLDTSKRPQDIQAWWKQGISSRRLRPLPIFSLRWVFLAVSISCIAIAAMLLFPSTQTEANPKLASGELIRVREAATKRLKATLEKAKSSELFVMPSSEKRNIESAIRDAVKAGAAVSVTNTQGDTALHIAAGCASYDLTKLLLNLDVPVTKVNKHAETPLHVAAYADSPEIVRLLLAHGASPAARDQRGDTPLKIAQEWKKDAKHPNSAQVIQLLKP